MFILDKIIIEAFDVVIHLSRASQPADFYKLLTVNDRLEIFYFCNKTGFFKFCNKNRKSKILVIIGIIVRIKNYSQPYL